MDFDRGLTLVDFISQERLAIFEEAVAEFTGMATIITDADGRPVTKGSNFTDFCMKYTRNTELGGKRCEWCDKFGAEQTRENNYATTYICHAGLTDFAAPILVNDNHVGCIIGGQVLTKEPDYERIRNVAIEIGVNPDEYVEAVKKVKILPRRIIVKASEFLFKMSYILSDMAYGNYQMMTANEEIEKASKTKSDFLANMSHEIRTPMNAVIGMAEMALREDLPPAARDYIHQIKSSGRELLTIINDILDFSKIESGKMDIIPVEYETMSIINDVVNIIMTRLRKKNVELILDLNPAIPNKLFGDNIRIKQVLINIANNAAKFTNEGKITIHFDYEPKSKDEIIMNIAVEDTGIGIKPQDLDKLFKSFQQVDSKRNRNVEGTGLGLAISKNLLSLMGGDIKVESVYGTGSTFSFSFPQKIMDTVPSIDVEDADKKLVAAVFENEFVRTRIAIDCEKLGVMYAEAATPDEFLERAAECIEREHFVLIEKSLFNADWENFVRGNKNIRAVVVVDFFDTDKYDIPNLMVMKKPIYALNLATLLKGKDLHYSQDEESERDFDFIAPDAEVLVVDDNAVNLTITEGLLKPLQMKIQTALSGKEAIDRIETNHFDLIFMDHMMPEMDGVETTRVIRRFHKDYNDVPIIALTANAVDGTKDMFLSEGMNDFVSKPIELRTIISKVKQWLPVEKIKRVEGSVINTEEADEEIVIGDLNTKLAISMLGSKELFWSILETYYKAIEKRSSLIKELLEKEDWARYTIEVHSLKSFSKQVGAMELAEAAAKLEQAGNARDTVTMRGDTDAMLAYYRGYIPILEPFFKKEDEEEAADKPEITNDILNDFFVRMSEAVDNLDMDSMEEIAGEMRKYRYEGDNKEMFGKLIDAIDGMDTDACEELIVEWGSML